MRTRIATWCAVLAATLVLTLVAHASPRYRRAFLAQYPAAEGSRLAECQTCHLGNPPALNFYGLAFKAAHFRFDEIEALDSDKDGASNLKEIQALSYPGDPTDKPGAKKPGSAPDTTKGHGGEKADSTSAGAPSDSSAGPDSTLRRPTPPDTTKAKH